VTFRRSVNGDTWHWCSDCSNWPTGDHDASPTPPQFGTLCSECESKEPESELRPPEQERLSTRELEKIRDDIHKSGERVRGELERLEALIILARSRESGEPAGEWRFPLDYVSPNVALTESVAPTEEHSSSPPPDESRPTDKTASGLEAQPG
jgi:hypothetical protein